MTRFPHIRHDRVTTVEVSECTGTDNAGWQKDAVPGSFELVANADYSEADIIYDNPPR
jgi:hypothetical protein